MIPSFLVAVLEEVVNLGEGQEVDRLVEEAQGRRLFGQVRKILYCKYIRAITLV